MYDKYDLIFFTINVNILNVKKAHNIGVLVPHVIDLKLYFFQSTLS